MPVNLKPLNPKLYELAGSGNCEKGQEKARACCLGRMISYPDDKHHFPQKSPATIPLFVETLNL